MNAVLTVGAGDEPAAIDGDLADVPTSGVQSAGRRIDGHFKVGNSVVDAHQTTHAADGLKRTAVRSVAIGLENYPSPPCGSG
jgi:hypothetical protein